MSSSVRRRGIASLTCAAGLVQHARQPLGLLHRRLDPVEAEEVGDLLDEVDDVVERRRERDDVLAVERRDERLVQPLDDVVRDPVALLLADDDVARQLAVVGPLLEHPLEQPGGAHDVRAGLLEEVEELAFLGREELGQPAIARPVYCERTCYRWRAPALRAAGSWKRSSSSGAIP